MAEVSSPTPTVQIGDLVDDRYLLTKPLMAGAFSRIFSAVDIQMGVVVAVKLQDGHQRSAEREAHFLRHIHHHKLVGRTHCVRLLDAVVWGGRFCTILPQLGVNAEEWIQFHGSLALSQVQRVSQQVLDALIFIHDLGIVHAQVRPAHVLLSGSAAQDLSDLSVQLIDFAAARYEQRGCKGLANIPPYRAPEMVLGHVWGRKVDVFAFGRFLFRLYSGREVLDSAPARAQSPATLRPMKNIFGPLPYTRAIRHGANKSDRVAVGQERRGLMIQPSRLHYHLLSLLHKLLEPCPCKRVTATVARRQLFMSLQPQLE